MDFKKNQEVILKIDDLGNNGEGIGHVDGYALFVKEVLPGETIRAGIMKCKKNYGFARLLEVLNLLRTASNRSALRRVPAAAVPCSIYRTMRSLGTKRTK